jgi:hypothetical protein
MRMDKYFQFNLDSDMMHENLKQMEIHVSGKYFNMKEEDRQVPLDEVTASLKAG